MDVTFNTICYADVPRYRTFTAVDKAYQDSLIKRYGPEVRDVEGSAEPPGQLRAVRQRRAHADDLDRPPSHMRSNHGNNTHMFKRRYVAPAATFDRGQCERQLRTHQHQS